MKTKLIKLSLIIIVPIIMIITLYSTMNGYPTGINARSYAPGETTCWASGCHYAPTNATLNMSTAGQMYIQNINTIFPQGKYVGGTTYNLSLVIMSGSLTTGNRGYGVCLEILKYASPYSNAGKFTTQSANTFVDTNVTSILSQKRANLIHTTPAYTTSGSRTINFRWVAPPAGYGLVTFHIVGMVSSGSSRGGDYLFSKKYTITNL